MKFSVITNSRGKVIAIVPSALPSYEPEAPRLDAPIATRGNKIREIEVPDRPLGMDTAVEIRAELEAILKSRPSRKSAPKAKTRKGTKKA
jgi:hypothetical protein